MRGFVVLCGLSSLAWLSSCVPYQKYDLAIRDLEEAKKLNDDLVRKYHQELMKNRNGGAGVQTAAYQGSDADKQKLLAQNQELREQLDALQLKFDASDEAYLRKNAKGVSVASDGSLVLISDLLFPPGVAKLRRGHLSALDSVANLLGQRYPNERIIIEGHTDDDKLAKTKGLFQHNWNLGYQRALSVFEYMNERHQLPKTQMIITTYGYTQPIVEGATEDAKRQNRRVVIRRGGRVGGTLAKN
ncbi:MAG: OmpA family protein [Planctomycetota bacterium]